MRRALPLLLCLLAGLCACKGGDDPRAPFTDSRIPPGLEHRFYPPQGWAWGLIQIGKAPPVRYGVAAPATTARGQIIILPSYGETAEAWFWTVRDLVARGYVVWVLEGSGQGGSGRRGLPRDVVDAKSLDPDVAAVAVLAMQMSRERPRYLLAYGKGTPIAVRAAAIGLPLDGLILLHPDLDGYPPDGAMRATTAQSDDQVRWQHRVGLGGMRVPGGKGWQAEDHVEDFGGGEAWMRRALTHRWQRANPDLRMGSPSIDWDLAYRAERKAASAAWPRLAVRTLAIGADVCRGKPTCRYLPETTNPGPSNLHSAVAEQVMGFIDPARAALAPAPATVTLDDQS